MDGNNFRYKDGQEVQTNARIKITRDCTRSETYNLTLNLIKRDEAGDYEVKATNTLGTAGAKSHVTVISKYFILYITILIFKFSNKRKANSIFDLNRQFVSKSAICLCYTNRKKNLNTLLHPIT